MGVGGQRPFTDLGEQVANAEGITQCYAQGQRIDEETDETFKLMARTVGDRRADHQIILTTESGEYDAPTRQYRHKQRGVMPLPE
ncbi:hypothetical protein Xbed_03483 [Xenorhabdus beddingii]|uniref:Uncharacterized protein n=1 Tax=Xenorhabdus beddingii TaxID=40578 RepID=A0A1Y2SEG9_9GAMM|nr:hypothetical protein Xbed_03483 [Xenorhabdus beddingii]